MMVQTTAQQSNANLLRRALQANSIFSGFSGALLSVAATPIAQFLGLNVPFVLVGIGVSLILFAVALFYVAAQESISRTIAIAIIDMDAAWVVGSWVLLFSGIVSFTNAGWWAVAIVADIVTVFAVVQYIGLRRVK